MAATGMIYSSCPQFFGFLRPSKSKPERSIVGKSSWSRRDSSPVRCRVHKVFRCNLGPITRIGFENTVRSALRGSSPGNWSLEEPMEVREVDVVVIGAGIGGLCCAGLLARYGINVVVLESHDVAGGAGHSFKRQGFNFDSGPSFHAGLSTKPSINPLKQVLDALEEKVDCVQYKSWVGYLPEGTFYFTAERDAYSDMIGKAGGAQAAKEWKELEVQMAPLAKAATGLPAAALRADPAVVLTAAKFLPGLLPYLPYIKDLLAPFSKLVDKVKCGGIWLSDCRQ